MAIADVNDSSLSRGTMLKSNYFEEF